MHHPDWFALVVTVGAAARLTRLVTRDTITKPFRDLILFDRGQRAAIAAGQDVPAPTSERAAAFRVWMHKLVTCDWCAGMWISALVIAGYVAASATTWTVYLVIAGVLTLSYLVGWLAEHESPAP